jgi:hypothetical protein
MQTVAPMTSVSTPEIVCVVAAIAVFVGWFVVMIVDARKPDGKERG